MDWNDTKVWLAIGFLGNALFFSRFMVQWIASERAGRSYIPTMFWWLSIAGSIVLLLYAVHKRDPVFIIAYLPNCVVYVRNLMLIRKQQRESAADSSPVPVREPEVASTTLSSDEVLAGTRSRT
jgi:lipid-A-disaccharide synthase-like uncharacterized protein